MIVATPEKMREVRRLCHNEVGHPSAALMENAGRSTYRLLEEYLRGGGRVAIFCTCNNARRLRRCKICLTKGRDSRPEVLSPRPPVRASKGRAAQHGPIALWGAESSQSRAIREGRRGFRRMRSHRGRHIRNGPREGGQGSAKSRYPRGSHFFKPTAALPRIALDWEGSSPKER